MLINDGNKNKFDASCLHQRQAHVHMSTSATTTEDQTQLSILRRPDGSRTDQLSSGGIRSVVTLGEFHKMFGWFLVQLNFLNLLGPLGSGSLGWKIYEHISPPKNGWFNTFRCQVRYLSTSSPQLGPIFTPSGWAAERFPLRPSGCSHREAPGEHLITCAEGMNRPHFLSGFLNGNMLGIYGK